VIAIFGADTMVGRAISALLEVSGYRTTLLDSYPTGIVDELLDGAHLVLLPPRLKEGVREAFVGAIGNSTPQRASTPVLALYAFTEEGLLEDQQVLRLPWPCEMSVLVERIEAALVDAQVRQIQ
jgi:hypothetical protein